MPPPTAMPVALVTPTRIRGFHTYLEESLRTLELEASRDVSDELRQVLGACLVHVRHQHLATVAHTSM